MAQLPEKKKKPEKQPASARRHLVLLIVGCNLLVIGLALLIYGGFRFFNGTGGSRTSLVLFVPGALLTVVGLAAALQARALKHKLRRGNVRLMTHIVALIELGVILVAIGTVGIIKLSDATQAYYTTARTNVFKDKNEGIEAQIQGIMLEKASNANKIKNNVISSRRKAVSELIDSMAADGADESEIIKSAASVYVERADRKSVV